MKSKKEYLILAVVIAALAGYLVLHKTDRTHYELPAVAKLTDSKIDDIKITKDDQQIELKKNDDQWLIYPEKYPADKNKIDPMVDVIKDLTVTAMVSEAGSSAYARYELDPENKITVEADAGGTTLRTFDIGKAAPSNRHTFIKLPDDNRVYHARENFRSKFDQTIDELRDKTVLRVDRNQVHQVEIKDTDDKVLVSMQQVPEKVEITAESKPESEKAAPAETTAPKLVWQDAEGNPVKDSDINNFFNNVSDLKCKSYITDKTKADFKDPIYTLTMSGTQTYTLSLFDKINEDDDTYPATSSESDYVFTLPDYKVDNMVKKD